MHIAEVLSQDAGGTAASIIEKMEMEVAQVEQLLPMVSPENTQKLRDFMMRLAPRKSMITEEQKLLLWKLSYRLWNSCVDIANAMQAGQQFHEEHVKIRQVASDLLLVAGKIDGIPSCLLKIATFFHRTGVIWHKIQKYEVAASCFEKATELVSEDGGSCCESEEERKFSFELLVARAKTAWEIKQRTLTCTLLGRAKGFLFDAADRYRDLAEQYLHFGKCMLAKSEEGGCSSSDQSDYVKFLNQAFEICSEALFKGIGKPEERVLAKNLKLKTLRYLAAAHLQAENFESVLKCVAVLKEESDHPTTPFLALKAYIGLGMREAAEKELNVLLLHGGAPVDICISAVEIVIQSGSGGLETARSAFFRLLDRFPSSMELPLRVLDKILRNASAVDQSYKAKVALALQIACDDKIVRLFADSEDGSSADNRRCIHAILWNSGSEFFRAKLYDTSSILFEGSMLYLPLHAENSACRAKSLRVLCLCHLGLSQYDRANEFIMEAEKFKICLQLKDEAGAIKQLERMIRCTDFDAEYLTLASHEAIACKSIGVATSALSNLLKLCSSAKQISSKEMVVVRNIILLHLDDPNALSEVLKYFNYAKKRMQELGIEQFFGTGITVEKEINWFAGSAWNSGLKASKSNNFDLAAELFTCASEFYGALEDSVENLKMLSKSSILSIASMLTSQKKDNKNHLTEAVAHLDKVRKVQASLASKNEKPDESLQMYSAVLEFELRGCMREHKLQLQILKQSTTMKGCKPEFLLKMGIHACQSEGSPGEYGHLEVASTALNACLHMELSSPFPDYKMVSLVIRKLIGIADAKCEEEECLGLYKQAHQIIIGMKSGEYPTEEAKWLVSTAWNRSSLHMRFNRLDEAEKWMRMGLDLVKHVPFMHQRFASSMADTLAKLVNPST
ncbi:TPR repeat-containing protein ZIP4 isoform X2 [Cryptomeria japonica]|uniref:TPR repeat-containing protein ZIP4 isoform X2 n=1 Tax=Cryptomeria japonica TaxID=3369 RepID=UPI0027D9E245|nr:TPR repeat-containing protein ZIP4 isoform X2 [Cryptomeria japonica]